VDNNKWSYVALYVQAPPAVILGTFNMWPFTQNSRPSVKAAIIDIDPPTISVGSAQADVSFINV
jgi:hypothetical protein